MSAGPQIVVVGSYMRDSFIRVDRFPAPGETVFGSGHFMAHGGKGSNQAVQAARCGAGVAMVAALGDDENGQGALDLWAREGLATSGVVVRRDRATGIAMIVVDGAGENQIIIDAGANLTLCLEDIDRAGEAICAAALVVAQLEVPVGAVRRAFEIARSAGVATLLNTAPAPRQPIADLVDLTDILVANEAEAAALTGISDRLGLSAGVRMAAQLAPELLVVTAGSQGAYLFGATPEGVHVRPPHVGRIVDTTGAGDAFIGAFASNWVETRDAASALRWGLAAGSLACTAPGALPSFETREAIARQVEFTGR
jgi:ribokinase